MAAGNRRRRVAPTAAELEVRRQRDTRAAGRRTERERTHRRQRRRARFGRMARRLAVVAAIMAVALVAGWYLVRSSPELAGVERQPDLGRRHVAAPEPISYDTPTPTSGTHRPGAPECGVYTTPLPPELAVHGLEHGAVVLWYQADRADLGSALVDLASEWDSHVIVSPNTEIDDAVVATAWRRLKTYDDVSDDVRDFVDTYRRRGPERVDCPNTR